MSAIETIAFATLWLVLLALAALVLLLYRQVEKAYQRSSGQVTKALPPGTAAPKISVLEDGRMGSLELPTAGLALLVFVTTTCDSCRELTRRLAAAPPPSVRTMILITGEGFQDLNDLGHSNISAHWVNSPGDIMEAWGITVVPTLYLVRDMTIVAASSDASPRGLQLLMDAADEPQGNSNGTGQRDGTPAPIAPPHGLRR